MKSQYLYAFDIHKHGILRMLSRREHVCKFEQQFVSTTVNQTSTARSDSRTAFAIARFVQTVDCRCLRILPKGNAQ